MGVTSEGWPLITVWSETASAHFGLERTAHGSVVVSNPLQLLCHKYGASYSEECAVVHGSTFDEELVEGLFFTEEEDEHSPSHETIGVQKDFWDTNDNTRLISSRAADCNVKPEALLLTCLAIIGAGQDPSFRICSRLDFDDDAISPYLMVLMAAAPGGGKSSTLEAARRITPRDGVSEKNIPPPSAAGLIEAFSHTSKDGDTSVHSPNVVFLVDEVRNLDSILLSDHGSGLIGALNTAAFGRLLSTSGVGERSRMLPAGSYAIGLSMCAQRTQLAEFFATSETGLTARFIFVDLARDEPPPSVEDRTAAAIAKARSRLLASGQLGESFTAPKMLDVRHAEGARVYPHMSVQARFIEAQHATEALRASGEVGDEGAHRPVMVAKLWYLLGTLFDHEWVTSVPENVEELFAQGTAREQRELWLYDIAEQLYDMSQECVATLSMDALRHKRELERDAGAAMGRRMVEAKRVQSGKSQASKGFLTFKESVKTSGRMPLSVLMAHKSFERRAELQIMVDSDPNLRMVPGKHRGSFAVEWVV